MFNKESDLINRAVNGDIKAFETIIINYEKTIYNIAYRIMNSKEDAKDISQEVCIKIYKNINKCKDYAALTKWVYTITYNTCIDEIRKKKNNNNLSIDEKLETEEGNIIKQIQSNEITPEQHLIKKENSQRIQKAISKLSQEHKTLIILRDINGLNYNEIANITKLSLGTVKSRISRARNNLKQILNNEMEQKDN